VAFRLQSPPQRGRMPSRRGTTGFLAVAPLSGRLSWLRGEVPARWQAGVLCHALSRLAARGRRQTRRRCFGRTSVRWFATHSAVSPRGGGRLRCPDDARAAPREAGVRRHAAALVGHLAAGLLRTQVSCRGRADDCIARMMRESRPCEVAVGRRAIAFVGRLIIGSPRAEEPRPAAAYSGCGRARSGSRSWRRRSTSIWCSMHRLQRGRAGRSTFSSPREGAMSSAVQLLDTAGRPRSPATMSEFHAGRAPGNKGQRYPADPPTVDEIIAVMRHAAHTRYGNRLNGLIVVLWRAGLRINEALSLTETDLEERRGSILVRHGKNDRRRQVGMDAWGWSSLQPWLAERAALPGRPVVLRDRRTHCRARLVGQRGQAPATPCGGPGRRPAALRAPPAPPCARCRAAARRDPAAADPTPARALAPLHDRHLPTRNLRGGDHLHRARPARADDACQRRPGAVEQHAGAQDALPQPAKRPSGGRRSLRA